GEIGSQLDFAPSFKPANRGDIGTDQRRVAKRQENSALPRRLAGICLADCGPEPGCIWPVLRQTTGGRTDEIAVAGKTQNLETGLPPFLETLPISPDRALRGCVAHSRPPQC